MKLHEEIFDVLGEIDEELLPDLTEKTYRPKKQNRVIRWTAAAAVVCLLAGGSFLFNFSRSADQPPAVLPDTVFASDIVPWYLLESREEQILTSDQLMIVPPLTGISLEPQIFTADSASEIVLPDNMIFADRDGGVWRLFSSDSSADDLLEKNLRTDLMFVNYIRAYGCVLWKIDRTTEPAQANYLGIVPLVSREEAVRRLLDGQAVTTIPETELPPEGITEESIGRRTLVYLTSKDNDLIRIYECFFVRLTDSVEGGARWGLYYVPVTDEEQTELLLTRTANN